MTKETREIKSTKTVYIAYDGTEFSSNEECEMYEKTAECIIRSKVNIKRTDEWKLSFGEDCHSVEIVSGKKENVVHYVCSRCFCCDKGKDRFEEYVMNNVTDDSFTIIYYNSENEVWNVCTQDDLINRIKYLTQKTTENSEKE